MYVFTCCSDGVDRLCSKPLQRQCWLAARVWDAVFPSLRTGIELVDDSLCWVFSWCHAWVLQRTLRRSRSALTLFSLRRTHWEISSHRYVVVIVSRNYCWETDMLNPVHESELSRNYYSKTNLLRLSCKSFLYLYHFWMIRLKRLHALIHESLLD